CLVVDNGWVGHLQDVDTADGTAVFHPLQLPSLQKVRAEAYIGVRDVYQQLYIKEAEQQTEHKEERETLNQLYDALSKGTETSTMLKISNLSQRTVQVRKCLIWSVSLAV